MEDRLLTIDEADAFKNKLLPRAPHPSGSRNPKANRLPSGDTVAWQEWFPAVLSFDPRERELATWLGVPILFPARVTNVSIFFPGKLFTGRSRSTETEMHPLGTPLRPKAPQACSEGSLARVFY